jgi:hypothetical protein
MIRRSKIKLLNLLQSRLTWGLMVEIPQGLNEKEIDMFMYCRHSILKDVYYELEKIKEELK